MKTKIFATLVAFLMASPASAQEVKGFLYTSLNGEGTNQVISFERYDDGSIGNQLAYSTESLGGANRAAGGDAAGDFDSQGAIQIIGNYLLVVNAGGNTISVFGLDRSDGSLILKNNVGSGGTRPVTIATFPKSSGDNGYWVVVGNQWNNPNVQKGGDGEGPIEMYPNAAYFTEGGGHDAVLDDRNIQLFSFDAKTGVLTPEKTLDKYAGTNGGPTTVAFNRDGTKLAVSTWGIAHFGTKDPTNQKPSRVYVYNFDDSKGNVSNRRYFEEVGVAGSIGFSWDKNTSTLFVSNFNLVPEKRDHSLTVLVDDGNSVTKAAHFGTGNGDDIDEACWTTISADGRKLYVSSFGGNLISEFDVDTSGKITKVGSGSETKFTQRKVGTPAGDTKDMYLSNDGSMYVLGAYQTFTLSRFEVSESGALAFAEEYKVAAATQSGAGAYNFLGLTGFDK